MAEETGIPIDASTNPQPAAGDVTLTGELSPNQERLANSLASITGMLGDKMSEPTDANNIAEDVAMYTLNGLFDEKGQITMTLDEAKAAVKSGIAAAIHR